MGNFFCAVAPLIVSDMHMWGEGSMALHRYKGSFSVVFILPHITVNEAILCSVWENQNQAFYVKQEGAAYWIKSWGLAKSVFRNHTGFQKVLRGIFMTNSLSWQPATHFLFSPEVFMNKNYEAGSIPTSFWFLHFFWVYFWWVQVMMFTGNSWIPLQGCLWLFCELTNMF